MVQVHTQNPNEPSLGAGAYVCLGLTLTPRKKGFSLFGVCLFLGVRNSRQNKKIGKRGAPETKNGGNEWTGPPNFGERGETAVTKELKQFNVYDVFAPLCR